MKMVFIPSPVSPVEITLSVKGFQPDGHKLIPKKGKKQVLLKKKDWGQFAGM